MFQLGKLAVGDRAKAFGQLRRVAVAMECPLSDFVWDQLFSLQRDTGDEAAYVEALGRIWTVSSHAHTCVPESKGSVLSCRATS